MNALDAAATEIEITIKESLKEMGLKDDGIKIIIKDNGIGITNERYDNFSELYKSKNKTHKGVGRLVFLKYFNSVAIESVFDNNKKRNFIFDLNFKESNCILTELQSSLSPYTQLTFSDYTLERIGNLDYIDAHKVKIIILQSFYPTLMALKKEGRFPKMSIKSIWSNDLKKNAEINEADLPVFSEIELEYNVDLFNKIKLEYSIIEVENGTGYTITAMSIDGRLVNVPLVAESKVNRKYQAIFILSSDFFTGLTDESRTELNFASRGLSMSNIKTIFKKEVNRLLSDKILDLKDKKKKEEQKLYNRYPHLVGYFDNDEFALLEEKDMIDSAFDKFVSDQKNVLNSNPEDLSDEEFKKSVDLSSRSLAEYVLFRNYTISKLDKISGDEREKEIHDLIIPMNKKYNSEDLISDLYRNNLWLIDDKFMTYTKVLSNFEMTEVFKELEPFTTDTNSGIPDIAIYFNADPRLEDNEKVDIVIVELKKKDITPEQSMVISTQIEKRIAAIGKKFIDRINKAWYYGILDISNETLGSVRNNYDRLFSHGKVFHKNAKIYIDNGSDETVKADIFLMDYDSLILDAKSRNSIFLEILRNPNRVVD